MLRARHMDRLDYALDDGIILVCKATRGSRASDIIKSDGACLSHICICLSFETLEAIRAEEGPVNLNSARHMKRADGKRRRLLENHFVNTPRIRLNRLLRSLFLNALLGIHTPTAQK